ncbi:MAG: Na/Pi cotransporter family protein [Peptostreptococcaceae bacterium]|nr:Na/Pi cotransporter family protein [Peptostreptococcaceae bacterium]
MYGKIILSAASGLGLFLYGMNLMGSGLQKAAGEKLKSIVGLLTKNKYIAVVVGIVVTAIIQSSSATTVMVIGFVNAGIMTLNQAIGVIMGANVGTTVTAQLVSFNLEAVAPLAVALGMLAYIVNKGPKTKDYAEILIGFGILFVGMVYMKDAVKPLREVKAFQDMLISFGTNPILGIFVGFLLTLLLQSSSASIGILVALAVEGALPLTSALPILYGDNIGTCTTALLSSIGASKNAQRAAVMHLTFNVIGTIVFVMFLNVPIIYVVTKLDPMSVSRQIANAHTLFNITNVLIQLPFSAFIVKFAEKVIPAPAKKEAEVQTITKLDKRMLSTPSIALESAYKECLNMGAVALSSLKRSVSGFLKKQPEDLAETFRLEKDINQMEREIIDYLVSVSNSEISLDDRIIVDGLFNTINDIERIGDHAENIAELGQSYIDSELNFSQESRVELAVMIEKVFDAVQLALDAMRTGDIEIANRVLEMENQVDDLEKSNRAAHIYRLNNNMCRTESGILFLDLISNLERISDHAANIAESVLNTSE